MNVLVIKKAFRSINNNETLLLVLILNCTEIVQSIPVRK